MAESVPRWAIDSVQGCMDALSERIEPEAMKGDKSTCIDQLRDEYEAYYRRHKQLLADDEKLDVFPEFQELCTQVSVEMKASWDALLESEKKLTAIAACIALSAAIVQAAVVGMVISVIGTTIVRSKRHLLPNEKAANQRDALSRKRKLLSDALARLPDIRYPAFAIEQLGLPQYQKLMDQGQRKLSASNMHRS